MPRRSTIRASRRSLPRRSTRRMCRSTPPRRNGSSSSRSRPGSARAGPDRARCGGYSSGCILSAPGAIMKFFVDTADTAEIRDLAETGLLDGVTTNPSLVHKAGRDFLEVVKEICSIVPNPVSAEVVATDHKEMMREADVLRKNTNNNTNKMPLTVDGLKTCKALTSD